jgi:hypothetical protein
MSSNQLGVVGHQTYLQHGMERPSVTENAFGASTPALKIFSLVQVLLHERYFLVTNNLELMTWSIMGKGSGIP